MAPPSMLSHCAVEAVMPPGSTRAWRCMIMPVWVQISKCPIHNCSLIAAISRCTSPRRPAGIFMSKAQARCSASISHPGEGELVVGPLALGDDRDFVVAGAFERPVVVGGDVF